MRGPENEYDFEAKERYRLDVWDMMFAHATSGRGFEKVIVLILPGKHGREIPLLLEAGVREENIVAVDESAALIATAPWRKTYPAIRCYGNLLSRAASRMLADGVRIDAANLDFCGNFSTPLLEELKAFGAAGVLSRSACVAVTTLKGREHPEMVAILEQNLATCRRGNYTKDEWRDHEMVVGCSAPERPQLALYALGRACRRRPNFLDHGDYRSSTQTMEWCSALFGRQ